MFWRENWIPFLVLAFRSSIGYLHKVRDAQNKIVAILISEALACDMNL